MMSGDGRFVVFQSNATDLASVPDTNGAVDIYVRDMQGGTMPASVSSSGALANNVSFNASVSDDGTHVVFTSYATNLVLADTNGERDVFVHELASLLQGTRYHPTSPEHLIERPTGTGGTRLR